MSRAIDGLIREVQLDQANGLEGKTAIHPSHVAVVNALSVVSYEEYRDATDVLARRPGQRGAARPGTGNKMNEIRPHTAWARRTLLRSRVFGVAAEHLVRRPARREPVPVTVSGPVDRRRWSSGSGCACTATRRALLGLALRRNPRRAQLLVSRVLGKHVPTDPRLVRAAGLLLGGLVGRRAGRPAARAPLPVDAAARRGGRGRGRRGRAARAAPRRGRRRRPSDALVLGFAETATALGHCVAEAPRRRRLPALDPAPVRRACRPRAGSPRTTRTPPSTCCCRRDPRLLRGGRPLVLVDDELSTGRTVLNTITALHRAAPRAHYVVAALVDLRAPARPSWPTGVRGRRRRAGPGG